MIAVKSEPADIDEIFRLYRNATELMRAKGIISWPEFDREMVVTEIQEGRQWKFLLNGEIACIWAITYSDPEIWGDRNADPSVYIHRIATHVDFRGNGFVSHIVDWAKEHSRSKNLRYIRLDTVGENHGLIHHYTKHGFSYLGLSKLNDTANLPAHYHDATVSLFQIELPGQTEESNLL